MSKNREKQDYLKPTRTPLDDIVDEIDELYPIEEERQISIRKQALKKILERYFN